MLGSAVAWKLKHQRYVPLDAEKITSKEQVPQMPQWLWKLCRRYKTPFHYATHEDANKQKGTSMAVLILKPAYGRDYTNKQHLLRDWKDNKDFAISQRFGPPEGEYINREDLLNDTTCPYTHVKIRYNHLRKECMIPLK